MAATIAGRKYVAATKISRSTTRPPLASCIIAPPERRSHVRSYEHIPEIIALVSVYSYPKDSTGSVRAHALIRSIVAAKGEAVTEPHSTRPFRRELAA